MEPDGSGGWDSFHLQIVIFVNMKTKILLHVNYKSHDGSCFAICSINFFLLLGLGCKNAGLSLTLRYVNIRRTNTLGFENGGPFSSFRFDLHLHRFVHPARQEMPHASLALLIDSTMLMLSDSRSRNTLSRDILPNSERIVVWASWVMANSGSSTPYDAR
uniref:Uncharacterized protein n=1 Tax=Anopheles minimus TaxID=112268 RepID=A0A182VUT1_9DIPT